MQNPFFQTFVVCGFAVLFMHPMLGTWLGDGVIHLRIAEVLAQGHRFEFNPGEPVVATTSLLWTLVVAGLFKCFEPAVVCYVVKLLSLSVWFFAVFMTIGFFAKMYSSIEVGLFAGAIFALSPGVFQNSVGGMEAPLAAFLDIALMTLFFLDRPRGKQGCFLIALTSLCVALVRPEGILVCLLLSFYILIVNKSFSLKVIALIGGAIVAIAVNCYVNLTVTGTFLPASGIARMASGLRESWLAGPLHVHFRTGRLFLFYFPLTAGLLYAIFSALRNRRTEGTAHLRQGPFPFLVLLIVAMSLFYTFGTGARHAIRYWTPFFPILAGLSAGGLYAFINRQTKKSMRALVVSAFVICMAGLYSFEYRQRLADGIGTDHKTVSNAVANRQAFTKSLMDCLQIDNDSHGRIKIAVTEVQVRYYLDDSSPFVVLSLDGRTSPNFARYVDRKTGIRYFDKFLRECKPDFIELGQFDKGEPILYELTKRFEETSDAVIEKGFVFKPTKCRSIVRYLGEISPNHS